MTRRFWFSIAAIVSLGLSGACALAQTVTPSPAVLTFPASPVGVSGSGVQKLTATFQITNGTAFIPATAVLHYGTSYSAGAVTCTGTGIPNETCTVLISFSPTYPGGRRDAVFLMNGTTRLAAALLYGVGQSPLGLIQPGVITTPIKNSTNYQYTSIVDENGTAYVVEQEANAIESVTKAGVVTTLPITGLNSPRSVGIDGAGVLYIADQTPHGPTITYDTVRGIQGSIPFPTGPLYIQALTVGNTGNIYETDSVGVYTITPSGTSTYTPFNPVLNPGPAIIASDSADNIFLSGTSTIYELTVGSSAQTVINTVGAGDGLGVDAAGTLYGSRYSANSLDSVGELPASNYSTNIAELDPTASPLGNSVGSDGTVWVGNYNNLDKVDRTQGLVAFGNNTIGTQTVSVYNGGNQALTVSNIALTGSSAFTLTAASTNNCTGGITIAPGAVCNVVVSYSTTHAGVFSGTLTFTDNSLNSATSTHTVAITAEFQGIYVTASPASLNFNTQTVGTTSATQPIVLTNGGDLYNATINPATGTGPFTVAPGTCTAPVPPNGTCTLQVSFTPTTPATYNNTSIQMSAFSSGGGPAQTYGFTVSGTGIQYVPYAPPSSGTTSALLFTPATVNLVAGLNGAGSTGNGGLATAAKLNYPVGLAYDSGGNLFFADENNNVVRRIDHVTGDISVFAGTSGTNGFSTGGGVATSAQLGLVSGLVIDTSNNIYVADRTNNVVWKITSGGTISIYAGGASSGLGDGGLATAAKLNNPWALGIDASNNVYIADSYNDLIRVVNQSTNIITTFAGVVADAGGFGSCSPQGLYSTSTPPYTPLQAHLCFPEGIAFDSSGNAYIVDTSNNIVRVVNKSTGFISTYAGGGTNASTVNGVAATTAAFHLPAGVYVDPANRVYIGDFFNSVIRVVDSSQNINTVFGNGIDDMIGSIGLPDTGATKANVGPLDGAYDFTMDPSGNLVVTDSSGSAITSAGSTGQYVFPQTQIFTTETTTQANTTSSFYPPYLTISNPSGVALSFTAAPVVTGPFAVVTGSGAGTCVFPGTVAPGNSCTMVLSFTPTLGGSPGTLQTGSIVLASNANSSPSTITLSGTGTGTATVSATLTPSPLTFTSPAGTTSAAQTATLTNTGQIPIAIGSTDFDFTSAANFALSATTCPTGSATLAVGASCTYSITFTPTTATTYSAGFQACVSTSSYGCLSISLQGTGTAAAPAQVPQLQFNPAQLSAIAGTGTGKVIGTGDGGQALLATFNAPIGIAQDASGNIYVSDQDDNYVRKIDTTGKITAFAGMSNSGPGSFSGDNGQATAANLSQPIGIAIDAAGNVYIADYGNSRIRKVVPSTGVITTYAGLGNGFFNGGTAGTVPLPGPQGIAFDPAGNLFVACSNQQIIAKITPGGSQTLFAGVQTNPGPGVNSYNGDNQLAINADLNFPTDVATDQAGNVYIADSVNARIRKVTVSTGIITTVAGTGTAGNTGDGAAATSAQINANSIATNLAGELFIGTGTTIRKVDVSGKISTYAGGGTGTVPAPATTVLLNGLGLARVDNNGSLLIPSYQTYDGVLSAGRPGILQFGNVSPGTTSAPQTITFENTGDSTLTLSQSTYPALGYFNVTGGTCNGITTLASGATCTLIFVYAPQSTGPSSNTYPVASNSAGGAQSILLTGTGGAPIAPVGLISPNPDAFLPSPVGQGETAPQPMSFTNTGNAPMTITGITITGANASSFSETNLCPVSPATLAAGSSCGITVQFDPTTGGALTANVSVTSNATNSPTLGVLTGTGTAPQLTLNPNPANFGSQTVGTTSAPLTVTLSNPGAAPLQIISTTLGGANQSEFQETGETCQTQVAAGANCTFTFIFTPTATGARTATLVFVDNATDTPQTLTLNGNGTAAAAPQATLNPNPVAFPSTAVGASSQTMTMSLGNPGNATLNITSISITGANASSFSETNNCAATLALDSSCIITITFKPTTTGALTASVTVVDNAANSPQSATITGTGTSAAAPQATLSPSPLAFPSATVGTPTTLPMTLTNPGSAVLNINSITVTGTNASNFTFTNGCSATLGIGLSCTLQVTFTPTSAGSFSAAISVSDNATGSPHTANLTGTGTAVVTTGTFTVNSTTPSASVQPGGVAVYNLVIAPVGGTYSNLVTLSATGLPAGATASFAPAAVTPGSAGAPSVLSIQTPSLLARETSPHRHGSVPLLAVLAGLPLFGLAARRFRKASRRWMLLAIAALAMLPALALTGCNGGYFGPAPQTFTVTVVGTSGSLQETTTVSLTVQ
jgi:sugar lactone lactonase YvrE